MKISKNSWHYRFLEWCETDMTKLDQFCPYMRTLVFKLISAFVMGLIITIGVGFLLYCVGDFIGWVAAGSVYSWVVPEAPALGIIVFTVILTCVLGIPYLFGKFVKGVKGVSAKASKSYQAKAENNPNIFTEYLKALHNKMCPTVEFTEKEEK